MLKAFLLPYWFTSFSTPRFRGHAMGVFASAQANLTDSYQHLSKGHGSAEGAPGYKAGQDVRISFCLWGQPELWQAPLCVQFAPGPTEDKTTFPTNPQSEDELH